MNSITGLQKSVYVVMRIVLALAFIFSGMVFEARPVAQASGVSAPVYSSAGTSSPRNTNHTSAFLMGKVGVGVILPESTGANEEWSGIKRTIVASEIQQALNNWSGWMNQKSLNTLQLTFEVNDADLGDLTDYPKAVTTNYEPIEMNSGDAHLWINEVLHDRANGGYADNSIQAAQYRMYDYLTTLKLDTNSDWGFIIFVVDSSADADGKFSSGDFFYSDLYGPYMVVTYDSGALGSGYLDLLVAREIAHIFGAGYQDWENCDTTADKYGYLAIANSSCGQQNGSLMDTLSQTTGDPDETTFQQVGWRDTDGDHIFDPVDTTPVVVLKSYTPDPAYVTPLTYLDTAHISYKAYDRPYPATDCSGITDFCYAKVRTPVSLSINKISRVKFLVDGDGTDWGSASFATADIGAFDTDFEPFNFSTPVLTGGQHTIFVRANSIPAGLVTTNPPDEVGNFSAVVKDKVLVIGNPINDDFANAKDINELQFIDGVDISSTSFVPQAFEKASVCNGGTLNPRKGIHSVWYKYTPPSVEAENIYIDTIGSDYDTYISIWVNNGSVASPDLQPYPETPVGANCHDDIDPQTIQQSNLTANLPVGNTYYIEVAQYGDPNNLGCDPDKPDDCTGTGLLQFRVSGPAAVKVRIKKDLVGEYYLKPLENVTPRFGTIGGLVQVKSTTNDLIFTSERTVAKADNSFNEVMGYPVSQLDTEYWFPWYDDVSMYTWLLVGNPSQEEADVEISIGNNRWYDKIPGGGNITPRFGIIGGPVRVRSTNDVLIFTSERTVSKSDNSFEEVMGLPAKQLGTEYWFPWYDDVSMYTWLLVGNPNPPSQVAEVEITIGNNTWNFSVPGGENITPRFGTIGGLVKVKSTNDVPIFASERSVSKTDNSFSEVMGYPVGQFDTEYWFPWYDDVSMYTWLLVGNPTQVLANVEVVIGDQKWKYQIPGGEKITPRFGILGGPVQVRSTNNVPLITSERSVSKTDNSFNEVMGYPTKLLDTEYWFPWYDDVSMYTWLLAGRP